MRFKKTRGKVEYVFEEITTGDDCTDVVIPSVYRKDEDNPEGPVVGVASEACINCGSIRSVTIPESILEIGNRAFAGCRKLVQVCNRSRLDICAGKCTHGDVSYYAKNICADDSDEGRFFTTEDGFEFYCFKSADGDEKRLLTGYTGKEVGMLRLPRSAGGAFYDINDYAFYQCDFVESVEIPYGVREIGEFAFAGSSIRQVSIPESVEAIGWGAFEGCERIEKVCIKDLEAWCGIVFHGDGSNPLSRAGTLSIDGMKVHDLVIPRGVTSIGGYSFYGCRSLKRLILPDGLTSIGEYAFCGCVSLIKTVLPGSLGYIGECAFSETGLLKVELPGSLTALREGAFMGCRRLMEVHNFSSLYPIDEHELRECLSCVAKHASGQDGEAERLVGSPGRITCVDGFFFYEDEDGISMTDYLGPDGDITLPVGPGAGGYSINDYAFYGSDVTRVSVREGTEITAVGRFAFSGCGRLRSVYLGQGVKSIGDYAFSRCAVLEVARFGENLETVGRGAFCSCVSLDAIGLPEGLTSIGDDAFRRCYRLKGVEIHGGMNYIGSHAFDVCDAVEAPFPFEIGYSGGEEGRASISVGGHAFAGRLCRLRLNHEREP